MSKEYPWGKGTPRWVRDAVLNSSDKSFTVPTGKYWDMKMVHAAIIATATVGNRTLQIAVAHDGTNYTNFAQGGNIAASQKGNLIYSFAGVADDLGVTIGGTNITTTLGAPPLILPAGAVIRVWDYAAVDAAADDLTVVLHYVEYDV